MCAAVAVFVAISLWLTHVAAADWEPAKSAEGIEVYQKPVENSPFKATRGTMLSNARMFDVLAVLKDVEACPQWLHKCKLGKMVSRISEREHVYYTVIDSPFLLRDRDTYVRSSVTYHRDPESLQIDMRGVEDTAPVVRKRVRVLDFRGRWLIEKHDDRQVRLVYELHMDPQVSTAGAANSTMATSVLETLRKVDRLAQSRPYLDTAIPASVTATGSPAP